MENFDLKAELLSTLKSSEILKKQVDGGFHNLVADDVVPLPRIIYQELDNNDSDFLDNKPTGSFVRFQVSIYCNHENIGRQTTIAKEVDRLMKSIGYVRYDSIDLYEEDTGLFHKPMRYSKKLYSQ